MAVEEIDNEKKPDSMTHHILPEVAKQSPPATAAWGTWEELLLAYAVNRYGTESWDSISSELQKRSSVPIHLTPHHCKQKYGELKRRFNQSDDNDVVTDDGSETTTTTATATTAATAIPWLEELRNLRVLELQRKLQNYDLYISSLQSKVKKLKEEGEKTGGETKENSDLGLGNEEAESEKAEEATYETPEAAVSGDEDSVNGNLETGVEKSENENGNKASPVGTGEEKPESVTDLPEGREPVKTEPGGEASESPESIAESKSEGKNSDVQSSASKSRRARNNWVPRGSTKMDEQDQSTDSIPVRSLPLVDFMQKLQKVGSVLFERRLDRQEKLRYKNLIKQHIDYDTLQTRLKEGWYSDGNDQFFRDLLLLVNNTRIFFPKQSPESTAAVDLRQFILNEQMIIKKKPKTNSKPSNLAPKRPVVTDPPPKLAGSIAVCRKRSSITAKAGGSSSGKKEQPDPEKLVEENLKKSQDSLPLTAKKKGKSPVNETVLTKPEKRKKPTETEEKKQGAAKFLNRMKRSNEPLLTTLKSPERDGKKEQAGKTSSRGKEEGSPGKRSVGRPPKRSAATPPAAAVSGKRNRESIDSERVSSKARNKRSKR